MIECVLKILKKYEKIISERENNEFPLILGLSQIIFLIENTKLSKDKEITRYLRKLYSLINEIFFELQKSQRPTVLIVDPLKSSFERNSFLKISVMSSILTKSYRNLLNALERILSLT